MGQTKRGCSSCVVVLAGGDPFASAGLCGPEAETSRGNWNRSSVCCVFFEPKQMVIPQFFFVDLGNLADLPED